jgi:hypothetical protein
LELIQKAKGNKWSVANNREIDLRSK